MTTYHGKHLPTGILPGDGVGTWSVTGDGVASRSVSGSGVATWGVADAERWRMVAVPTALAPAVGGWFLAFLVTVASASAAWHRGRVTGRTG
ncbi:hypothetical protein ACIGO6_33515 [Streptomyces sp. NPDC053750]|uniref:hypothetical protein n=1 Tax=Streptomyces sp. NPDC053750 TaxID=3365714 RepID=UPI0037D4AF49